MANFRNDAYTNIYLRCLGNYALQEPLHTLYTGHSMSRRPERLALRACAPVPARAHARTGVAYSHFLTLDPRPGDSGLISRGPLV